MYLGDYNEDNTKLGFEFTSRDTSSVPITLAGTPVITVVKISDGVAKTSAESYITLTADIRSRVKIDLSGDAFFAVGEDYSVYISTGTVDGGTVAQEVVAHFSIENRSIRSDVISVSGDSAAADNLEATYDGTGYVNDVAPATQVQVGSIGATSGSGLNFAPDTDNVLADIKSIAFVGVQTSGTFANLEAEDDVYHVIDDDTDAIDIVYGFSVGGGRTAVEVTFKGFLNGQNDAINVQAYDFVGADWETRMILSGQPGSSDITDIISLLSKHTGTGSDLGKVYIRFQTTGQSNPTLNINELLVEALILGQSVGYADGAIWVNTVSGTAGTENFVNGTADNPVLTWADALTLSSSLGMARFHIVNGSTITLSANSDHYTLIGDAWTLALNGQSIVGIYVEGASVSGIAAGTGTTQIFEHCIMNAVSHIKGTHILGSGLAGTQTVLEAGDYFLDRCHSGIAGTGTWIWEFGDSIGSTNLNVRNYSGGIQLESMGDNGTDTASIEGFGQIIEGTCTGGVVAVRGHFTLSGITNLTIVDDARYKGSLILASTTIATLASQTSFTLTNGSPDDNAYRDHIIVITDQVTTLQRAVGKVSAYVGSSKTVTLAFDPDIFTMATGDRVDVLSIKAVQAVWSRS